MLLAIKMTIHLDLSLILSHTLMHGTPINICIERGHGRTTWVLDNGKLSYSLVTDEGLKLFTVFSLLSSSLNLMHL